MVKRKSKGSKRWRYSWFDALNLLRLAALLGVCFLLLLAVSAYSDKIDSNNVIGGAIQSAIALLIGSFAQVAIDTRTDKTEVTATATATATATSSNTDPPRAPY